MPGSRPVLQMGGNVRVIRPRRQGQSCRSALSATSTCRSWVHASSTRSQLTFFHVRRPRASGQTTTRRTHAAGVATPLMIPHLAATPAGQRVTAGAENPKRYGQAAESLNRRRRLMTECRIIYIMSTVRLGCPRGAKPPARLAVAPTRRNGTNHETLSDAASKYGI